MALTPESEERKSYKNIYLNTAHGNNEKNSCNICEKLSILKSQLNIHNSNMKNPKKSDKYK